jgi:hypothetical protein
MTGISRVHSPHKSKGHFKHLETVYAYSAPNIFICVRFFFVCVSFYCSGVRAWELVEMRESHAKCVRLDKYDVVCAVCMNVYSL